MQEIIFTDLQPQRLDKFLILKYPTLLIGRQNKYLRENKIKVNGKKMPLTTKLNKGDKISLYINDENLLQDEKLPKFMFAKTFLSILYEDENLLAVDKPSGIAVNDETHQNADTLINRAKLYLYKTDKTITDNSKYPALCHRLDTGTSGVVLIAKNKQCEKFILARIKAHEIKKEYLCVTFGHPNPANAVLKGFHTKNAENATVKITDTPVNKYSKPVETRYETLATSGVLALLKVQLITGRTHQIRAHLNSIGCPILGDSKYGNNAANRKYKFKYQALSAYSVSFPKTIDGDFKKYSNLTITAPKPWYYTQITDKVLK